MMVYTYIYKTVIDPQNLLIDNGSTQKLDQWGENEDYGKVRKKKSKNSSHSMYLEKF